MNVRPSKLASSNGELLGATLPELDPIAEAGGVDAAAALGQHLRALVDPDDAAAVAPGDLDGDGRRSRGDVEHGVPGPTTMREARNERQRGSWPKLRRRA